ncbi:MAG: tyrosine-type recombinase/integrase [Gemmatimonadaceae bacterium]
MVDLIIPGLETGAETRRRYATSLQRLRRKLRVFALQDTDSVLNDPSFFKWCRDIKDVPPSELGQAELKELLDRVVNLMHYIATDSATIADLEILPRWAWRVLQHQWEASSADWNHMRRALSAVLTGLLGTVSHPTRGMIMHNVPTLEEFPRVPDLTPQKFKEILSRMPEYLRGAPWVLVITGMRMNEYMTLDDSHLRPNTYSIVVPGTKTRASRGTVHVSPNQWATVIAAVPAPRKAKVLRAAWTDACIKAGVPGVRLHDLRHCLAQWTTDAGVAEKSVQSALRHLDPAMTRRYSMSRESKEVSTMIDRIMTDTSEPQTPSDQGETR